MKTLYIYWTEVKIKCLLTLFDSSSLINGLLSYVANNDLACKVLIRIMDIAGKFLYKNY